MATQPDITIAPPCIEIAPLGALPQIPLLGGAQLNAFIDIAGGTPTDCKLKFNLLLQLGPLFASMACLFKILNVISALKNFVSAASDPMKLPSAVPAMLDAIAQLETCIPALQIPNLIAMIKHILLLIIGFVECVLEQIDSVLKFKLTLDFDGAQGNPTLLRALQCASDSADASLGNTMSALQPLQFLMTVVTMIAGITGSSINLPDFSTVSTDVAEIESTVASLESAMQALQSVVETLPG
jgi:hypothetical protein